MDIDAGQCRRYFETENTLQIIRYKIGFVRLTRTSFWSVEQSKGLLTIPGSINTLAIYIFTSVDGTWVLFIRMTCRTELKW